MTFGLRALKCLHLTYHNYQMYKELDVVTSQPL